MWTTLVLVSSLGFTAAQADLSLTHVRSTHGLLGPQRDSDTLNPGDMLFVCFDIEGITADEDGKVRYSTAIEISNAGGKVLFKQQPQSAETQVSLGGNRVAAYAYFSVGVDAPAGEYGFKIVVKDLASGKEKSVSRTVKVLPKDFALVRAAISSDVDGRYPSAVLGCGQGVWVHCSAVGFERDRNDKQPHVVFEIRVRDQDGKPVCHKPTTNVVNKDVSEKQSGLPMAFPLSLNRPGKFTVELLASDRISGKKAKISFPISVQSGPRGRYSLSFSLRPKEVIPMRQRIYFALIAVLLLFGDGLVLAADAARFGKLTSPEGTLFARTKFGQPWETVSANGSVRSGDLLFGLPGATVQTEKNTVRLTLMADLNRNSPYPILEAAVILHDNPDFDLDFTLDRGRVDVRNTKKEGAAHVRIRFHDQKWEATLQEPGARIALELYGRWPKGVPFTLKPGPKDIPAADLVFLVLHGHVDLIHGGVQHALSAPPGPAILHWDNSGQADEITEKLDELPSWANKNESTTERARMLRKVLEEFRAEVLRTSLAKAAATFAVSEDATHRALGVIVMGATDDASGMYKVFTETKYPDTWDRAVVVLRSWLGRGPGQDQLLYQRLIEIRKLPPARAQTLLQLLHSFGDADLAQPELYKMLVKYLDHEALGIRGLANWHLVRLVPAGQKIAFNPLAPKAERDTARNEWKKLIDALLAKGELPPKTTRN
jgi:hypothetical protein